MAKTLKERYIEGLKRICEVLVKQTHKYDVYTCTRHPGSFYYVGRSGALRVGPTVAGSMPASSTHKQLVLSAGVS